MLSIKILYVIKSAGDKVTDIFCKEIYFRGKKLCFLFFSVTYSANVLETASKQDLVAAVKMYRCEQVLHQDVLKRWGWAWFKVAVRAKEAHFLSFP